MILFEAQQALLTKELDELQQRRPGFADRLSAAMRAQRIDGSTYVYWENQYGCAYGHIGNLKFMEAVDLAQEMRAFLGVISTPMEILVLHARPGETTDGMLYLLERLQPYCTQPTPITMEVK